MWPRFCCWRCRCSPCTSSPSGSRASRRLAGSPMSRAVTGVILAGGESRRMGRDKAHLPWGDRTLIEHIVDTLRPVTNEIIVVANDAVPFSHLRTRVVEDLVLGAHALGGLYTGLTLAAHEQCFVCACDAPFLNPALIQFLIQQADGWDLVIPRTREGLQPLHAVYRRSILPAIEEQLRMQRWDLRAVVPNVRACIIGPEQIARFDPEALSFFNVNTPNDYATAGGMSHQLTQHERSRRGMRN